MSGLEVIGGISAIITFVEASTKIYENAQKDLKLSEAFITVGSRLPIILETLQTCKNQLEPRSGSLSPEICAAVEQILDNCKGKARELRNIFEEVIPGEKDGWQKRYKKMLKTLGKGKKVEELMLAITEDARVVVDHQAVRTATSQQITDLEEIMEEMKAIQSPEQEEATGVNKFDSGGGPQMNNVRSHIEGGQINNLGHVTTQNYNPVFNTTKPDYTFKEPVGICLNQAPHMESRFFVGRANELEEMAKILLSGDDVTEQHRLVLGGTGGMGKTQLALVYAQRHSRQYNSIFWLDATSVATVEADIQEVARHIFGASKTEDLSSQQAIAYVREWLSHRRNSRWLLIFDNYNDPTQYRLEKYCPIASHGTIVITTRRPDRVRGPKVIVTALEDTKEGLEILATRSQREDARNNPNATALAVRLAGFPLALATAGTYLQSSSLTFQDYYREYDSRWVVDAKDPPELEEYHNQTLYTTWSLSYDQLKSERSSAAKLLRLLAYFGNRYIYYELLDLGNSKELEWLREEAATETQFSSLMRTLTKYHFVEVQQSAKTWSIHNCIHDWTLAILNQPIHTQQYWYAFDCVVNSIIKNHQGSFSHAENTRLAHHAVRLTHIAFRRVGESIPPTRMFKAILIADLLGQQVQLGAAEMMYLWALARIEEIYGPEAMFTLSTINSLGVTYMDQGKLREAGEMYLRVLSGFKKTYGTEDRVTLAAIGNLALIYSKQGRLSEAKPLILRGLAGNRRLHGLEDESTLESMNDLGNLYWRQGDSVKAEFMLKRALAGKEKVLGLEDPLTLRTVNNLGNTYIVQDRLGEAEQMYDRALIGYEKTLGPDHTSTLCVVNNLGCLYAKQGKLAEAEQMHVRARAGYEKVLGPEHTSTLTTVYNSGLPYRNQGNLGGSRTTSKACCHRPARGARN